MKLARYAFGVFALAMVAACGSSTTQVVLPAAVTVAPKDTTIQKGQTVQLRVVVLDVSGDTLAGVPITYRSADSTVATVSSSGLVTSKGPLASVYVRAAVGALADSSLITVIDTTAPVSLVAAPHDTTLGFGDTAQVRVTVTDPHGNVVSNPPVVYGSANASIATVSPSGLITAQHVAGITYIRASLDALADSVRVSVVDTTVVAHLSASGTPFAVGTSPHGVDYVGYVYENLVTRLDATAPSLGPSFGVGQTPSRLAVDSAGAMAVVSNQLSDNVMVIDAATNTVTDTIPVIGDPVPVAISGDDQWLYVATNHNVAYKIDLSTKQATDSIALPATPHFMLLAPSDSILYLATRDGGTVLEIRTATWTVLRTFTIGGRTQGMALSPDGKHLYVANETLARVDDVDLSTGAATPLALDGGVFDVALSADGSMLYASIPAGPSGGEVEVVDVAAWTPQRVIAVGGMPACLGRDGATGLIVVANQSGWVDLVQ